MEALLVTDDLDGTCLARLVVKSLDNLAKGAFAEGLDNLVAEAQVVLHDNVVVTTLVVEAEVVGRLLRGGLLFLGMLANKVDLRIFKNLGALVQGEVRSIEFQGRCVGSKHQGK
ncbi:hypothetical protein BC938DRAFT_483365 [Jimgerdemannia flammicorona]|uniref:Uncharacterized protein n=1 Tax=Jimgerdemannia flammicorona TaxID=994334 RepID=A0A433QVV1_9FUNG|nr:hypothetical protein BC938DRAFT_483365 [Jimgerdemannia flammicorona]